MRLALASFSTLPARARQKDIDDGELCNAASFGPRDPRFIVNHQRPLLPLAEDDTLR